MNKADRNLINASKRVEAADQAALAALKHAIKPGRRVHWPHGTNTRSATVIEVVGYSFEYVRLKVRGDTGVVYFIDAHAVINHLE